MNTTLLFGMPGGTELIIIMMVVLLLFGGKKIPELMRGLGKGEQLHQQHTRAIHR